MKLATYHKMLGDEVTFFKGNVSDLVLSKAVNDILFYYKDTIVIKSKITSLIETYIKKGNTSAIESLIAPIEDPEIQYQLIKKLKFIDLPKHKVGLVNFLLGIEYMSLHFLHFIGRQR